MCINYVSGRRVVYITWPNIIVSPKIDWFKILKNINVHNWVATLHEEAMTIVITFCVGEGLH